MTPASLTVWRGPGELVVDEGDAAVAHPGVVIARSGSRVCAVDGGLVVAERGARVWAWDGGVVDARAGSEVVLGQGGAVDARAGARVDAEGDAGPDAEPGWPQVVSRGAEVVAVRACVVADEGSRVTVVESGRLRLRGDVRIDLVDGRDVDQRPLQGPVPDGVGEPAPGRWAGRPVLCAEPPPGVTAEDWLEPLVEVVRECGARVAPAWTTTPTGPARLIEGVVDLQAVAVRLAVPPTVTPQRDGRGDVRGYGTTHGARIEQGRVAGRLRGRLQTRSRPHHAPVDQEGPPR